MIRILLATLAVVTLLLGLLVAHTLADVTEARTETEARLADLSLELSRLRAAADGGAREPASSAEQQRLRLDLLALQSRLSRLEAEREQAALSALAAPAPVPSAADGVHEGPLDTVDAEVALREEFLELLAAGVLDERATQQQQQRFWELARTTPVLSRLLAELEERVQRDPGDAAARMQLADAYVTKLLTVPGGPERGLWGDKAEAQWRAVADADPGHWEAHVALGENYSYHPPFMNKAGEALAYLSAARAIQERGAPEPAQVKTYVLLARVHQQQGDVVAARDALQAGLLRHPGDAELLAALGALP